MNFCKKTLLLYMFLILAAPGGSALGQKHPWSFMPMCSGDAVWWISVADSGKGDGHTLPIFTSMRIGRDTLMNARHYWYVTFPPETGIAEGWMRADSAGLYVWTGDAELRLVPSWASMGEMVNGGRVTDVTFVRTPFGDARSFTIVKDGKRLTWTDGIGLWGFDRTVNGRGRSFTWIARNSCGASTSHEPSGFIAPLRDGDILVHRLRSDKDADLGFQVLSSRKGTDGKEWISASSMGNGRRESRNFRISMSPSGRVSYEGNDRNGAQPRFDHYPAYQPPVDEITLDEDVMRIVARFDTTIFSETVSAFTMMSTRSGVDRTMTIADRFGVVYERVQGLVATLHSAVIGGKKYNRTPERWRYFPLCSGSSFAYRRIGPETNDVVLTGMPDTMIQGIPFVQFGIPAIPAKGGFTQVHAFDGVFREDVEGVLRENGELLLPAAVDLGDRTPTGIAIAAGEMAVFGAKRHFLVSTDIGSSGFRVDTLVDNIGIYSTYVDEDFLGVFSWRLLGGEICGNRVGVTSGLTDPSAYAASLQLNLYPNPAPVGSIVHAGIWSEGYSSGRLMMHDMLGRVVMNESVVLVPGGNNLMRSTRDLLPGVYAVSFTSEAAHTSALLQLR